ncbi:MAG: glycosyltransferase family 4 protein [Prevotellaceae bacterium]|nr:glycosyltransferase family 4 protein [Prevotellaceae bacterium]
MNKSILHVVNTFFTVPYFFGDQFLYLKNKGYKLHVICSASEYLSDYASAKQFVYKEIPILRKISLTADMRAVANICRYIRKNKIGIVVGHTPKGALLAMLAGWIMRTPKRIYFRHGLVYETSEGFMHLLLINMDRLTAFLSTKIVCVSPSLYKKSLKDRLNKECKQIVLGKGTCAGIDALNKFNPELISGAKREALRKKTGVPKNAIVIGYCGRIVRDKGIVELVNAFEILQQRTNKCLHLLLVGMFEDRDSVPVETKEKILSHPAITYTGYVKDDIELYYSLMSIFILPSYREGFGMSVLEASAMQLPVITTRATGCVDSIVENETGVYTDHAPQNIASALLGFIENEDKRHKYGLAGRKFVEENFKQDIIWREIEKLYQ